MDLHRFGGGALIAGGLLFLVRGILDLLIGPPPATGAEILEWVNSGRFPLSIANEILFFATMCLVPAVAALYHDLASIDRVKAAIGCGIMWAVVPVLAVLNIVHGRLVYPVYGIRISTPAVAELAVSLFYGGLHAIGILLGFATVVLSLAMARGYGKGIAYFGFATGVFDVIGAYPDAIGPVPTFVCQLFFAGWFVAVGWKSLRAREPKVRVGLATG